MTVVNPSPPRWAASVSAPIVGALGAAVLRILPRLDGMLREGYRLIGGQRLVPFSGISVSVLDFLPALRLPGFQLSSTSASGPSA